MTRSLNWLFCLGGLATLAGCPQPTDDTDPPPALREISAQTMSLTATMNLERHAVDIAAALKVLEESKLLDDTIGQPAECPRDENGNPTPCEPQPGEADTDFKEEADSATDWLRDHVFAESNIDLAQTTPTKVVYRLKSDNMCEVREGATPPRDANCVKMFDDLVWLLTGTSLAENDVDIKLTVNAFEPAVFQLHDELVSVEPNLGQILEVAKLISTTVPDSIRMEDIPDTLAGKVKATLTRISAQEYDFTIGVIEAVSVGKHPATHRDHFLVTVAPAATAVSGKLTAADKKVVAALDFNAIDVKVAYDQIAGDGMTCTGGTPPGENGEPGEPEVCTEAPAKPGVIAAHVAGVSASGSFAVANDTLTVTNVGLGNETSTVKYDDQLVFGLDLNKDAGRRFAFTGQKVGDLTTVSVTPSFAAYLTHNLNPILAKDPDDEMPAWAKDGFFDVKLDGATPKFELKDPPEQEPCTGEGGCPEPVQSNRVLRVASGKVTLAAKDVPAVTVEAPACLVVVEQEGGGEGAEPHPFTMVESGVCE